MKNTFVYHLVSIMPLILVIYPWLEKDISTWLFLALCFAYAFLFRPLLDYYRLRALGEIGEGEMWKMWKWFGFYRFRYYTTLMFGNNR